MGYEMIQGINISYAGVFCSVQLHTLHSKLGTYKLTFARPRPAKKFASYVEKQYIKRSME
jgi:hypothetical protein